MRGRLSLRACAIELLEKLDGAGLVLFKMLLNGPVKVSKHNANVNPTNHITVVSTL